MPFRQADNVRVNVYLNDDLSPIIMPNYQLHGLVEAWEKQGRRVRVFAHEDERPGFSYSLPRLKVIVKPLPERPLDEEIALANESAGRTYGPAT